VVRIHLDKPRYSRGEAVALKVSASNTTRTLVARMYGVAPVNLRWNEKARYNTGGFVIPADLPAGRYALRVTAEDFAHNIGSQEVHIEVAP
jgi:Ca-activated chloride channel family protein